MKQGRYIEKTVRLIHETLKDIPNTKVYSNYKIKNIRGRDREIDVLVESVIQGLNIKIAIECKDYKISVPVEKIEAFNSKCLRIKGISKKVFVSTKGYQADAIEAANDFDIELYNINEISASKITSWLPIVKLNQQIRIKPNFNIQFVGETNDISNEYQLDEIVIYDEKNEPWPLVPYIWNNFVVNKRDEIWACLMVSFVKKNPEDPVNKHFDLPFVLTLSGVYILGRNNKKLPITKIESALVVWFEEEPANIIDARSFYKKNNEIEANTLSVELDKNNIADLIFSKDKISVFHTTSDGSILPMETIAIYDPKTNTLEFTKDKNAID
jgi:hypothetical protein